MLAIKFHRDKMSTDITYGSEASEVNPIHIALKSTDGIIASPVELKWNSSNNALLLIDSKDLHEKQLKKIQIEILDDLNRWKASDIKITKLSSQTNNIDDDMNIISVNLLLDNFKPQSSPFHIEYGLFWFPHKDELTINDVNRSFNTTMIIKNCLAGALLILLSILMFKSRNVPKRKKVL